MNTNNVFNRICVGNVYGGVFGVARYLNRIALIFVHAIFLRCVALYFNSHVDDAAALFEESSSPLLVFAAVIGYFKVNVIEYVIGVGRVEFSLYSNKKSN